QLSGPIKSGISRTKLLSPGRRKAYPCGSSSVFLTADLNSARSVASRLRNSAVVREQAIGAPLEQSFTAGSPAVRRHSSGGIRQAGRSGRQHGTGTPLSELSESLRSSSEARLAKCSPARSPRQWLRLLWTN